MFVNARFICKCFTPVTSKPGKFTQRGFPGSDTPHRLHFLFSLRHFPHKDTFYISIGLKRGKLYLPFSSKHKMEIPVFLFLVEGPSDWSYLLERVCPFLQTKEQKGEQNPWRTIVNVTISILQRQKNSE